MACTPICLRGARRPVTARRWRSAALVLAALVSTAASAQDPPQIDSPAPAQPGRRVSLHWNAPAGPCPGEPELLARIDALVDAAPLQLDATAWVQQLAVPTPAGEAWRLDLRLQWSQRSDTRILHARDCSSLADATVVLVAVLAAPLAAAGHLGPATDLPAREPLEPFALADEPTSRSSRTATPLQLRRSRRRAARRRGPYAGLHAIAGAGALPRGDFGLTLALGGLRPRLRLEGAATYLALQGVSLRDGSGRGGTIGLATAALRLCPRFLGPPLELSLCGALELGLSWANSVGLSPPRRSTGAWISVALGGALDWWFSPQVALHAGLEANVAPLFTAYRLDGGVLFTPSRVGLRGSLGLTIAFVSPRTTRPPRP